MIENRWLRGFFAARARSAHGFDGKRGRHLDFAGDAFARFEAGDDAMKDVRSSQLVLASREKFTEEPGVDVLDVLEPALRRAHDVVAALEPRRFDLAVLFGFAA